MSAVEQLRLRVPESADLSGEYQIDSDAMISLPGLGRIKVRGMTPEELEREISRKVSLFVRRDVTVSIEIGRFRPYFIMGMVSEPGTNEWRPGLNIIKAVALARGTVRPATAADDPVSALSTQQSQTQLQFSLALLARLKAERDGSSIDSSDQTAGIIANMPASVQPRLKEFLSRQNAVLDEQRALMNGQIAGFERDKQAAMNELETARAQEKAVKAQLDISQSLLNDVENLKDQKLVSNSRYFTQRSDLVNAQIRFAEAQSFTERAKGRVETVARQIETLQRERKSTLNERIETLQREVAQLEVNLVPARIGSEGQKIPLNLIYHIARETEKGITTLDATVFSEVLPGDVIVVSAVEPDVAAAAAQRLSAAGQAVGAEGDKLQKSIEASSAAQTSGGGRGGGGGAGGRTSSSRSGVTRAR
jgi:polysaccharide export outer membrane protein